MIPRLLRNFLIKEQLGDDRPPTLWVYHVSYQHKLKSGLSLIEHIYHTHQEGVALAQGFLAQWEGLAGSIDTEIHTGVAARLRQQIRDASGWRGTIVQYFQGLSGVPT